jgi:hypothetical protein
MQLPLSPEVLVPLGAGAVALVIALVVIAVRGWRGGAEPGEPARVPQRTVADALVVPDPPADEAPAAPVAGTDRAVGAAVAQALAARAALHRPPGGTDARDRLLAVLLDDPARAVGATVELDACRAQLARLSDALAHERGVLREVLARLAATGLGAEQLARLAELPVPEVRALLEAAPRR